MTVSNDNMMNTVAMIIFCVRLYGDDGFSSNVECVVVILMPYCVTFCKFSKLRNAVVCVKILKFMLLNVVV